MTRHPLGSLGSENRPPSTARKRPTSDRFSEADRNMAKLIRQTYIDERSNWETARRGRPYVYKCPAVYDSTEPQPPTEEAAAERKKPRESKPPVWLSLAIKLGHREIEPEGFIRRLFENAFKSRPPEPWQLMDREFLVRYEAVRDKEEESLVMDLQSQKQIAASNVSYYQGLNPDFVISHARVMLDESLELSALFRMCLAYSLIEHDIVFRKITKRYMLQAALQFQRNRVGYMKAWGEFIPEEFVMRSRRLYEKALRELGINGDWDGKEE